LQQKFKVRCVELQGARNGFKTAQSARVVALYTAAFALGQIAGPLTVSLFNGGLALPSLLAALALAASSLTLGLTARVSGESG
jgi:hypothetical protein